MLDFNPVTFDELLDEAGKGRKSSTKVFQEAFLWASTYYVEFKDKKGERKLNPQYLTKIVRVLEDKDARTMQAYILGHHPQLEWSAKDDKSAEIFRVAKGQRDQVAETFEAPSKGWLAWSRPAPDATLTKEKFDKLVLSVAKKLAKSEDFDTTAFKVALDRVSADLADAKKADPKRAELDAVMAKVEAGTAVQIAA